jgi:hypothetical protein
VIALLLVAGLAVAVGYGFGNAAGYKTGNAAGYKTGNAAGYKTGHAAGSAEGFTQGLASLSNLAESYQDNLIYSGYPMDAGTWYLIKLKAHKPSAGTANMYAWQISAEYTVPQGKRFELRADGLYTAAP